MSEGIIGIIGGSGLYSLDEFETFNGIDVDTPYGKPSDTIHCGRFAGKDVCFLSRHAKGHRLNPTQVPSRANIFALKQLGVNRIISVSAVGSLREEIRPRDLVIPDQLIDRTRGRPSTFFDEIAVHVGFRHPFCPRLSAQLYAAGAELDGAVHRDGTYVCMEGPVFSTRAESNLYRSWGASVIGMTALPEAKLAREAEICYAAVCVATDYDVWRDDDHVNVGMVLENLRHSLSKVRLLLRNLMQQPVEHRDCECASALKDAILTDPACIPPHRRRDWDLLLSKYL